MTALDLDAPAGVTGRLLGIARRAADDRSSWGVTPQFDAASRWYHRLWAADDHEAWLLTWLPGQCTDLHDHGGSSGAFVVVAGSLSDETVPPSGSGAAVRRAPSYAAGAARPLGAHHVHRIVNDATEPAVSLHVYGPALTRMNRYRLEDGALRVL